MTTAAVRAPASPRRTQADRSSATRERLLDATLELLVEVGWARTTTQAVAARAGLSRGAQLHHFPTKTDLVVSAVRHLAGKRHSEARAALAGGDRSAALRLLADAFDGPLYLAALELWVAARTDVELRAAVVPLEHDIGRALRALARQAAGDDADLADLTLDLLRGLGIAVLLGDATEAARRRTRLMTAWSHLLKEHT